VRLLPPTGMAGARPRLRDLLRGVLPRLHPAIRNRPRRAPRTRRSGRCCIGGPGEGFGTIPPRARDSGALEALRGPSYGPACLDGDYVSLWGLDSRGTCAPEVRGGPPDRLLQINVRADAIMYVAELPPARENGMEKFMEQIRRRRAAELSQAAPEEGRNDAA